MREIKFRGKHIDNGEWVEGDLFRSGPDWYIMPVGAKFNSIHPFVDGRAGTMQLVICEDCWFEVNPKTVGQFIDKKDKNGKEIYEGDIVKLDTPDNLYHKSRNLPIVFSQRFAQFVVDPCTSIMGWPSVEVIGNVHEEE